MAFFRKVEMQYLENSYLHTENDIVVLYGAKDIGKTSLLKQFCKNKDYFYYKARPCSEAEQINLFKHELKDELPKNTPLGDTWDSLINTMLMQKTEKRVIIIEEFTQIVKNSDEFMLEVVKAIHNRWNNQAVMFILCTSSTYWVENQMVEKIKESAYEISGILKVNELKFLDLVRNFKGYKVLSCVETYSILGGVEGFWQYFDDSLSVSENVCNQILKRDGYLHNAGVHILPEELREHSVYNTILLTLASGKQKLNDIFKHTGFSRAKISVYLKNLIDLEIVEKVDSYETAGKENAQKGIYRICNRYVAFWYKYVFPNFSKLDMMEPQKFYKKYIEPTFNEYVAECFKTVCSEYLSLMNHMGQLNFRFTKMGSWVGKVGTIDIVAQDEAGHTLIACCNWEKKAMSYEDYEWILFCCEQAKLSVNDYYLFSSGTFDDRLKTEAEIRNNLYLIDSNSL